MPSIFETLPAYVGDEVRRRAKVYNIYVQYYLGTEYDSQFIRRYFKLYSGIREFYSLISRAVDIDCELIPGGWRSTPDVSEILEASDWRKNGNLLVHFGAVMGDFYIKVYGDRLLQPLDPRGVYLDDEIGVIARTILKKGVETEVAELLTNKRVTLYENGKKGESFRHDFGFIPLFYGQNKNVGLPMGLNSFHNVLDEINAVNEMASFLQEQTLRALINQKVITGAAPSELEYGADKTIFLPQGATLETLEGKVNVDGTLAFLQDIKTEVKGSLPELAFDATKAPNLERPNSSTSLKLYLIELITKIRRLRVGYDDALERVIQSAYGLTVKFDPNRPVISMAGEFEGLTSTTTEVVNVG